MDRSQHPGVMSKNEYSSVKRSLLFANATEDQYSVVNRQIRFAGKRSLLYPRKTTFLQPDLPVLLENIFFFKSLSLILKKTGSFSPLFSRFQRKDFCMQLRMGIAPYHTVTVSPERTGIHIQLSNRQIRFAGKSLHYVEARSRFYSFVSGIF